MSIYKPETRKKLVRRMARELQQLLNQLDETVDHITDWDRDKAAQLIPPLVEQMNQVTKDLREVTSKSQLENLTLNEIAKYFPAHELKDSDQE